MDTLPNPASLVVGSRVRIAYEVGYEHRLIERTGTLIEADDVGYLYLDWQHSMHGVDLSMHYVVRYPDGSYAPQIVHLEVFSTPAPEDDASFFEEV